MKMCAVSAKIKVQVAGGLFQSYGDLNEANFKDDSLQVESTEDNVYIKLSESSVSLGV